MADGRARKTGSPQGVTLIELRERPMTSHVTTISESERDIRWREWQARGAASDRRTARTIRGLTIAVFVALAGWLLVLLA